MNKLPFLKENSWPKKAKIAGESKFGFSEDDELKDDAAKELMQAIEAKDVSAIMKAIEALVHIIKNKFEGEDVDAFKDA